MSSVSSSGAISASLVKELRERTGLGMMECKKALVETAGDIEAAITNLRKSSGLKAAKKAGRTAADGLVAAINLGDRGVMVEVNCETDFVARDESFIAFTNQVLQAASKSDLDVDQLMDDELAHQREELVQRIGENITTRRVARVAGNAVSHYVHTNNKIAVLVALNKENAELGRDLAMHIAATNPQAINPEDLPAEILNKEKEFFSADAIKSGKPPEIIEKIIQGRINKFLAEVSLVKQPFVKDMDTTIGAMLKGAGCEITAFARYEVGEGIEKTSVDFADEVRQQAGL